VGELNQTIVAAAALVPLLVVLLRRASASAWLALPSSLLNGAWSPGAARVRDTVARPRAAAGAWALRFQRALPILAILGVIAIALTGSFRSDVPSLAIGRAEAEAAADAALAARGVNLSPEWRRYSLTTQRSGNGTASSGAKPDKPHITS